MIRKNAPNIVKWRPKPAAFAAAKPGRRKRPSGSIGAGGAPLLQHERDAAVRCRSHTRRASTATPSRRRCHASWPTRCRAGRRSRARGRAGRAAPGRRGSRVRKRGASAAAVRPTGTLIQKIQCQSSVLTSTPPSSGPSATPMPAMDDHMPSAAVRRSGGKAAESSVSVSGMSSAAPRPCTVRAIDELRERVRERAGGRGRREHEQPDDEHAPAAVAVAERGAGQDQHGEARGCTRRRPTAGDRARRRDRAASTAAWRAR